MAMVVKAVLPKPSSTSFAPQPGSHTPLTSSDLSLPLELQPPTNVSQLFNLPAAFLTNYIPGGSLKLDWNVDADGSPEDSHVDFDLDYTEQEHVDEDGSGNVDVWVPEAPPCSRGLSVSLLENTSSTKSMLPLTVNPPTSPAISSVPSHWSNNSFPSHPKSPVQPSPSKPRGDSDLQWDGRLLNSASPETKAFIMAADVGYKQCLLIRHMFPEVVSKSHEFLCLAFDEVQALVKNSCSWRGSLVTHVVPEVLPTFNLTTLYPVDEIQQQVAANLAKNANFVFEKVSIAASGDIMMTPSGKPMRIGQFKHTCVKKAILHIVFRDKQAAAAIAPHTFCPVPLPLIAFGCVAIHYALEVETLPNGAAHPQLDCRTYNVHYTTYMDSLRAFAVSHADESLAVQNFLWNSGHIHTSIPLEAISNDVSFDESLSEEEFEQLMAANLSSGMAVAAQAALPG
ncbi:hypothetical protein K439DRAFT_1531144 [Ramaria rubella]|nr:hypothetical protein K439DRAFT_1531144 [Ramaria rubella]